jgi:hypothetical protein
MQSSNANQESRAKDSGWYLLGEYPLSTFLPGPEKGEEITAGLLCQTMRELGLPPEYIGNIERTLAGFAKEALVYFRHGRVELPGRIRFLCQRKMIDKEMKGGWGYFVIERRGYVSADSPVNSPDLVDLYLYKEGE